MAKAKKYFGEETKTTRARKTTKTAGAKRKYTPRAAKRAANDMVTITVPAQIAFQLGVHLGSTLA